MELKIKNGDYVAGAGRLETLAGSEALLQRVLYRLTARRGAFPFLENMGSRLHALGSVRRGQRAAAAKQYVAEALQEETGITVTDVSYRETFGDGLGEVRVCLACEGERHTLEIAVQ